MLIITQLEKKSAGNNAGYFLEKASLISVDFGGLMSISVVIRN